MNDAENTAQSKTGLRAALSRNAALIAFVLFVLFAGVNTVTIRFSNQELPAFWGAAIRFGLAALIFWCIVAARRIPLPRGRALAGVVLYGLLACGLNFAGLYWALVRVHAGLASIFLALGPLLTVFLAAAHGLEGLTWRRVAGAVVAVAGVALIVGVRSGQGLTGPVLLALIAFPLGLAEGAVILKLVRRTHPAATNAVAFSAGALSLAALSLLTGETWIRPHLATTWAALGYQVVVGTVLVFYLWLLVLARWPASRSAYGFVFMPVVSIVLSAWLTGEAITLSLLLGAAVVLAGVWLGAISRARRPTAPERGAVAPAAPCPNPAGC